MKKYKVGVFDSGVGGLSVANAIRKAIPDIDVIYIEDKKNVPYGTKSPKELSEIVIPLLTELEKRVDVIVIACNTVSTVLIKELKSLLKIPIIAVEPMVKTASEITNSNIITVCATPTTLGSDRYNQLKQTYAKSIKVIEPDCSKWSSLIEANAMEKFEIDKIVVDSSEQGADVIVLGCTHYHWIEDEINQSSGSDITVLQPEQVIISQLRHVLEQLA